MELVYLLCCHFYSSLFKFIVPFLQYLLLGKALYLFHNSMSHLDNGSRRNNSRYFSVIFITFKSISVLVTLEHVALFSFVQLFINEWDDFLLADLISSNSSIFQLWNILPGVSIQSMMLFILCMSVSFISFLLRVCCSSLTVGLVLYSVISSFSFDTLSPNGVAFATSSSIYIC